MPRLHSGKYIGLRQILDNQDRFQVRCISGAERVKGGGWIGYIRYKKDWKEVYTKDEDVFDIGTDWRMA